MRIKKEVKNRELKEIIADCELPLAAIAEKLCMCGRCFKKLLNREMSSEEQQRVKRAIRLTIEEIRRDEERLNGNEQECIE